MLCARTSAPTDAAGGARRVSAQQSSPTWRLVAIGDSIPFGRNDCGGCEAFPQLYGDAIARQAGVTVVTRNLSRHNSLTSAGLREEINSRAALRRAIASADIITVTIGHNDTPWNSVDDTCDGNNPWPPRTWRRYTRACITRTARTYGRNLGRILSEIARLRVGKPTALRVTDDYNDVIGDTHVPRSDSDAAAAISHRVLDRYSALTCRVARSHHAVCVDTYHAINGPQATDDAGPLLAPDHTHPNAEGHERIAALLEQSGYAPLRR